MNKGITKRANELLQQQKNPKFIVENMHTNEKAIAAADEIEKQLMREFGCTRRNAETAIYRAYRQTEGT